MARISAKMLNVIQSGLKAQNLVAETDLGARLPPGLLDSLGRDLAILSSLVPGTDDATTTVRKLTARQEVVCRNAHRRIAAIRNTVARLSRSVDVRAAYGVGETLHPKLVKDVVHGLKTVIARLESHPDEAREFGLVEADLVALRASLDEVVATDADQERARVQRPLATRDRDAGVRRVARAVTLISGAGRLVFVEDDVRRREFEALLPGVPRSEPDKAEKEGGEAPPPAGP